MAVYRSRCWIDIPRQLTVSQLMQQNVENTPPDKIIFEEAVTGKTVSYGAFHEQIKSTAHSLRTAVGLKPGQIVSIISSSRIDYILAAQAVWWAGGVVSPINNAMNVDEICHAVDLIEPDFVVVDETMHQKMKAVLQKSGHYQKRAFQVYTIGQGCDEWPRLPIILPALLETATGKGKTTAKDKDHNDTPWTLGALKDDETCAAILLSSGTTGSPKAVMLSHHNLVAACYQLRSDNPQNWVGSQREIFFPPLSHVYALYVAFTMCTWLGAYVCLMPRFDLQRYCRLMQDREVTLARLVPPIAKMLAENEVVRRYRYPRLEYFSCSAAPLHPELAVKLKQAFPKVALCQTYGCTELSGPCVQSGTRDTNLSLSASGAPVANTEMRFLDEQGKDVGARGPGEITCRGPNVMMGYKSSEGGGSNIVRDFFQDGWYRTGDLGYVDDDGYLNVYDRIKDVIKYKGFQVAPSELERILLGHPLIDEAVVVGVWDDDEATEVPRAFVTVKKRPAGVAPAPAAVPAAAPAPAADKPELGGVDETDLYSPPRLAQSIVQYLEPKVSTYKRLRGGVVILSELPKNTTGKVLKRELKTWRGKTETANARTRTKRKGDARL